MEFHIIDPVWLKLSLSFTTFVYAVLTEVDMSM